jgi:chromosome segregation protein
MRLTTLEIKGFKSFGEKVTIHFDKGVTSIVGPNGSGKSNVVDAMRWVLGEQKTRMLRSEKMENIIFNGTKTRKPSNLAEVSITFENTKNILPTEYSTVTVTRRLYRSGESEYLLNNVTCRLKDITDIFLDTGIGPDSYAIIELKMVDEILNDKNNAIKLLFEEAAGISKYKIRKKQTLARLEETDGDLNRVNDLLFEIERNMKTLESQAKKTERYYKLKEQYKELSSELALFTIASSRTTFDELQRQEEKQIEDRIAVEAKVDESEAELQKSKLLALDKEKELNQAQKDYNEKVNFIQSQENEKKISNEKLKYLQDKEQQLTTQLQLDKSTLQQTQEEITQLEAEKRTEESQLNQLQAQLEELRSIVEQTRLSHGSLKTEVNLVNNEVHALQIAKHESEKSFAVAEAKKDSLQKELSRLKEDTEEKQVEYELLVADTKSAKEDKEQKENDFQVSINYEQQMSTSIERMEEGLKKQNDLVMEVSRKLDAKENEYKLTKSLVDNLEGYPESLRYIRKSPTGASSAPLFSDVLSCKLEYKSALEIFLEPYMNYFVIEDIQEASNAVNLLSEASKGRANFFILKNFENNNNDLPEEIENCIHASQILDVDDKYRALCNELLRNVYIVTEKQDSTPFIQRENKSYVFISQNGKYCKTKHVLSGGSVGLFDGNRIGRTKHLEKLSEEISNLGHTLERDKAIREKFISDIEKTKQQREKLSAQKNQLQTEIQKASHNYSSLNSRSEHLQTAIEDNTQLIANLETQLVTLESAFAKENLSHIEHLQQLQSQYELLKEKQGNLQQKLNEESSRLESQTNEFNSANIACLQQQNKISAHERDLAYKLNLSQTLQSNITNNSSELENVRIQTSELINTSSEFDEHLIALYGEKEILEQNVATIEKDYYSTRGLCDDLDKRIRDLRFQKEQIEQLGQALRDKTTELKFQLNSLKERLSVEFGIDLNSMLDQEPSPDWTEEELREKVTKQKNQIENYGPINPMAVEAFNEINERYTFITTQKEDLLKAKESLLQTISEIEQTAKENFMTAFASIRENFIKVFRSLFTNDDDCDLILLDPSNPTESDIQIIAKPKGKRPLSISQLSGGEKTLTATALLFGIYLLKPAPFCIFDEVDAPLDDTNIDKFNNIIKKFSQDSQFIIITHNKRTMAATDIIYGITMVEPGVTQVVPVDLTEMAEEEA